MKPFEQLVGVVALGLDPEEQEQMRLGLLAAFPVSSEDLESCFVEAWWQERAGFDQPVEKLKPMSLRGDLAAMAIYCLGWLGSCSEAEWLVCNWPNLATPNTEMELQAIQAVSHIRERQAC
jgi:hypothetical protein